MNHLSRYFTTVVTILLVIFISSFTLVAQDNAKTILPQDATVMYNGIVIDGTGADPIPDGAIAEVRDRN